jgi:ACS family hexuronate transporter-like MFS transporter
MGIGAACLPASLLITASPINLAIVFFSMALFGHQFFSTVVQTLAADMFPSKIVGSVAGVLGAAGAFGAMLFNLLVGTLLTSHHRYILVFAIAGLLHPTSFAIILLVVRKIRPVLDISSGTGYASPQPAGQVLS